MKHVSEAQEAQHVEALVDAVCQALNCMGDDSNYVELIVKARLRLAFEPFRQQDCGDLMDLQAAHDLIAAFCPAD